MQYLGKEKLSNEDKGVLIIGILIIIAGIGIIKYNYFFLLPNLVFVFGVFILLLGVFYISSFAYKYGRLKHQQDVELS